jgi:WD40 repeat protein
LFVVHEQDGGLGLFPVFVTSVAYSSDGKSIVTGSRDRTARIWDVESVELKKTLEGHSDPVYSVAYSSDGRIITKVYGKTYYWDSTTFERMMNVDDQVITSSTRKLLEVKDHHCQVPINCVGLTVDSFLFGHRRNSKQCDVYACFENGYLLWRFF